jgi:PKD repeat protein
MNDYNYEQNQERQDRRNAFHFDALLAVFLLLSWPLIFATATMALQRDNERWLLVSLVSKSSADYSQYPPNAPKQPPQKPQIIQAVKEDEEQKEAVQTPTLTVMLPSDATPTVTVSPTPSPTPSPGNLVVSAGGPYETDEGSAASLTAAGFNSAFSILPVTYLWDLDGDGLYDDAEGASTQVTFPDEGDYPVAVKASDLFGRSALDLTTVAVNNVPPTVVLGPDRATEEGQEIAFLGEARDPGEDILFYEWDFGDGSPPINGTTEPTHVFRNDGEYVVRLRVSDNDGGLGEAFMAVDVTNLPPLVDAGSDQTVDEGDTITLSGTATDPADDPSDLSYAWDFDFNGETFTADASGQTASTIYEDGPANIVAALRVEDEDGGETTATVGVKVNNVAPIITDVSNDSSINEGEFLNIEIRATDVGKQDRLTYTANFGGSEVAGSSGALSKKLYGDGEIKIDLRVEDDDGGEAFTTTTVSVVNLPPRAEPQVKDKPDLIYEGTELIFDGTESSDPGLDPLTYLWDFGDKQSGTGPTLGHTYTDEGQYTVILTVKDDSGMVGSNSISILVLNANPSIETVPLDQTVDEEQDVTYTAGATDPGSEDNLTYAWDFNYEVGNFSQERTGASVNYFYPDGLEEPETHVVAVRVQDNDGGQSEIRTFNVKVLNLDPIAIIEDGDHSKDQNEPVIFKGSAEDVAADLPDLIYKWALDEDGTCNDAEGQTEVTKTWSDIGEHEVKLCVTDKDGGEGTATKKAYINAQPIVVISQSLTTTLEGTPITFNGRDSSDPDGDIESYEWNFGDGSEASGITATHIYSDNASAPYMVTLTVMDDLNSVSTGVVTVTINNANPTANAGSDRIVDESTPLTLTGTGTDPGSADIPSLSYDWDFDYDGSNFNPDAAGQPVVWPGADGPATITVALRVTDKDGGFRIDTALINVINVAPVADAGGPYRTTLDVPITLSGSGTDVPADIPDLIYEWDLENDGTFERSGQTTSGTWPTAGDRTIVLRVSDGDGGVTTDTATVDVGSPPNAVADINPNPTSEGSSINFDGSGSDDPDSDSLTYEWDFDYDGSNFDVDANGVNVNHTYADDGDYTVALRVADDRGGEDIDDSVTVTVNNMPPTAVAAPIPNPVPEGASIAFDASDSTDPGSVDLATLSYSWVFGDGNSSTERNPTHTYANNGTYDVTLTVTDKDGADATTTLSVTIDNTPPVADAGGPYRTTLDVPITLNGSGTDVPDDMPDLIYEWDFAYDGTTFDVDATEEDPTATWDTAGPRTVALRVSDGDGGVTIDTTTADVGNPPVANAGGPYTAVEGSAIAFNGGASDPDGDPLTYEWDFDYDGTTFNVDATGINTNHTYADEGSYTVALRVKDDRGGEDTDSVMVTVTNAPPIAAATANPNPVPEGTAVAFNAGGSTDPGSTDTLSYNWDFGDGTTANGINVNHVYADEGDYTVTLLVDDGDGGTDSESLTVTVNNAPPVAVANANPNPAPEGTAVTFDPVGSTDPGSADTLSYNWDFGDGNSSIERDPTHIYADNGDYSVTLTVTDDDGASATANLTVTVDNIPPTADAGGPYSTTAGNSVQLDGSGSDPVDSLNYNWDLDDDGTFETNGQSVTFTAPVSGTYRVTLEVSDGDGGVTTDDTDVQVNSVLPFAWLGLPLLLRRRKVLRDRVKIRKKPGFRV